MSELVPVPTERIPEGESGLKRFTLTETRLHSLAEFWAQPEFVRRRQREKAGYDDEYAFLAARLGVSTRYIRRFERTPRLRRAIRERVTFALTRLMPDIIWAQVRLAVEERDTKAARFCGDLVEWIRSAEGPKVNVQTNVAVGVQVNNQPKDGIQEDATVLEGLRTLKESGLLDKLIAAAGAAADPGTSGAPPQT